MNCWEGLTQISLGSSSLPGGITTAHSEELHFGQPNNSLHNEQHRLYYIYNILSQSEQICRIQSSPLSNKEQGEALPAAALLATC